MSYITHTTIFGADDEHMERVNAWMKEHDTARQQQFVKMNTDAAGGTKFFVVDTWMAAINYEPSGMREMLRDPETWKNGVLSVMVVFDGEDDQEMVMFGSRGNWQKSDTFSHSMRRWDYDKIECAENTVNA